jgi:hypothetical protein
MAEDQRDGIEQGPEREVGIAGGPGGAQHPETEQIQRPEQPPVEDAVTDRIEPVEPVETAAPVETAETAAPTEPVQVPAQAAGPDAGTERITLPAQPSEPAAAAPTERIPVPAQAAEATAATEQLSVPAQGDGSAAPTEQIPAPAQSAEPTQALEPADAPTQAVEPVAATEQIPLPTQPLAPPTPTAPTPPTAPTEQIQPQPSFQPPGNPYATGAQQQVPFPAQEQNPYASTEQIQPQPQFQPPGNPYAPTEQVQPQPQFQPQFQPPGGNPYAAGAQQQYPFGPPPIGVDAGTAPIQFQQPAQPLAPVDRWRAAAVGVLNLSGLGLGYALMRRWLLTAVCLVVTGILLVIALPADPGGVSGALVIVYVVFLLAAAVHGAIRGLRTPLTWPRSSPLAVGLAVVLLAVPIGGSVLYNNAQQNAIQQMLLGRLSQADQIVASTQGETFADAQPQYDSALTTYRDLLDNYSGSRAGKLVPNRLASLYAAVATPYTQHDYCGAIAPLTYLRSVPNTFSSGALGSLATWQDDRLATSLYQCGAAGLGNSSNSAATKDLSALLTTYPASHQAAQVEPAFAAAINKAAGGIGGSNPCSATGTLKTLATQATALSGGSTSVVTALHKDAATDATDVESGTYACGVSQYKSGSFTDAQTTLTTFVSTYPHDPNDALAQNFNIAAQIAQSLPAAGKVTPTLATGGDISVTFANDSPDAVEILYTGPVTGKFSIGACGSCTAYASDAAAQANACSNSSINYPQTTISLPAGTTYFLQHNPGNSDTTPTSYSEQYADGNTYGECAYETSTFGVGGAL